MSKKQHQLNRLKSLFNTLEEQTQPAENTPVVVEELAKPDALASWTWELDAEGNYTSCSREMSEGLGLPPSDVIGRSIRTFRLYPQSVAVLSDALDNHNFPCEVVVNFRHGHGHWILIRLNILSGPSEGNGRFSWRGFAQILPVEDRVIPRDIKDDRPGEFSTPTAEQPAAKVLKPANERLARRMTTAEDAKTAPQKKSGAPESVSKAPVNNPSALAVPFEAGDMGQMLLEVIDDQKERLWTEDERQIASEVATQLTLALENARLYMAAQQEIAERIYAEQVTLHRNQDLAILNRTGQRLSSLASRSEVFSTLTELVGQVLDNRNLTICIYERKKNLVSFPVYREDGQFTSTPDRAPSNELPDYVFNTQKAILFTEQIPQKLRDLGIFLPGRVPASLIAIPMPMGESVTGALIVQDFSQNNAPQFDEVHLELLSTAVAQAATALENAHLFEQMQEALRAIENRERYQGGVAQAAATLSEFGSQALANVLKYLGHAAQASRVYLIQYQPHELNPFWKLVEDWTSPMVAYLFDRSKIQSIPHEIFAGLLSEVRENGWSEVQPEHVSESTATFLTTQKIQTCLLLQVPSNGPIPGLLVFDQIDYQRRWLKDEINILQVAADAIANTYVREDLLNQLQVNLEETESLYNASNRLVAAGDFQEMLAAVINGVKTPGLNRCLMLLFENDEFGKISRIDVQGNWYSGYGTPPSQVGTHFSRSIYEQLFQTNTQMFIEDVAAASLDESLRQILLQENVRAIAILPMWSGKRQIGVLLVEGEQKHKFSGHETRTLPPLVDQLTIAVENMRLFEQTQTALAETALLYNISSSIAQAQNLEQMTDQVIQNVLPRGADGAAIILFSLTEGEEIADLEFAGYRTVDGGVDLKGMRLKMSELPVVRMLSDDGLLLADTQDQDIDPVSRQTFQTSGIGAIVLVPLRSGGRLIGALAATSRNPVKYDLADIRLLRTVANGIAVALEKQRLLREAQRRALELQTASEIARDTTSTLSLDLLLNRIVNLLAERFNYPHTAIYFIDDSGSYAVLREATGEVGAELKRRGHKLLVGSRSVVGMVTGSGEAIILNDVSSSPIFQAHPLLAETRAEMALPLRVGKRIIGAMDIQSNRSHAFSQEDINVLGILTDQISIAIENARAYELSQKAIEDMREVDRVKSQFLANMSHELRTPLNSIIGFSRVILKGIDGPVNDTQKQDLSAIYNSGQHLLLLINDILDLSKIEAGKMELAFSDINLSDMINSVMSTAVGLVKDKPIKLITKVPKDLPALRADSTRIRQVLINFLSNAAKFTDEGAITVEASAVTAPSGKPEILVTVTDTGPGIAEADKNKLFLPFSQVDDSPTRKTGGTGLGLSICRSLIEMHGGRIGLLSSQTGKGSTFFFSLPVPVTNPEGKKSSQDSNPENWTILSVDDDIQVINLYERYLRTQGYTVIPHTNPKTVVEAARKLNPLAILLDIMMPERDGWQVLQDLKNDPITHDIPIIICSILEQEEKGFSLGAADYLVKPFLQDDLLNALSRLEQTSHIQLVLVIDDDPDDLRLVQKMLKENRNIQVLLADGGRTGLEIAKRDLPDVIILDLLMPDIDGFSLLSYIRSDENLKNTPVIILTGADLTPEQHAQLGEFSKQLLAKGYLREKELLTTIEQSLRKIRPITVKP